MPQDPADLETLFSQALATPPSDRPAFLDRACPASPDLRQRLQVLLAAHDSAGDFMNLAAIHSAHAPHASTEGPGSVIGNYKLLTQIGEGGFGIVFLAEQSRPVRRNVALKIIKLGMDTANLIARFQAERQALAMMDHPHIAKVLDAGSTDRGRPFFVMEFAHGLPITHFCDQQKLSLHDRLSLVAQVAAAIQHAHQKGIIHRDLKPSNILVTLTDGRTTPKIIDFGIVKATQGRLTDHTIITEARQIIGTPLYMSPEQAQFDPIDIDTRSDIYSLGVLLYELLAGQPPFSAEELRPSGAIERLICHTDPPCASAKFASLPQPDRARIAQARRLDPPHLLASLKGEPDWITAKCLEKDRARRYDTALDLAKDIERFLHDQPVEASPPSTVYRLKKFVRRHRTPLRVATAFLLLLIIALITSLWLAARATHAQHGMALAQQQSLSTLADMYTARGLEKTAQSLNGRPLLWFANAAAIAPSDRARTQAALVRLKNWSRDQWEPVAAVTDTTGDRVAFSPTDPQYFLTYVRNTPPAAVHFWNVSTESELKIPAPLGEARAAAWASDGRALVGSQSGALALLQLPAMTILHQWHLNGPITAVSLSPDGQFAAAAIGPTLSILNTQSDQPPAQFEHPAPIDYLLFSHTRNLLLTAAQDQNARLFNITSAVPPVPLLTARHIYHFRTQTINPVFTQDGAQIMLLTELGDSTHPGAFSWYDTTSAQLTDVTSDSGIWTIRDLFPTPDGNYVAFTGGQGALYDSRTHRPLQNIPDMTGAAFDPKQSRFFCGDPSFVIAQPFTDGKIGDIAFTELHPPAGGNALSVSSDGRLLAVFESGVVQIWKIPTPIHINVSRVPLDGSSSWIAFSSDGQFAAPIGTMDGRPNVRSVQVYQPQNGKPAGAKLPLDGILIAAAFSPDTQYFATATGFGTDKKSLHIWKWQSGEDACPPLTPPSEPIWLAFSPDNKTVALLCRDGQLLFVDASTGQILHTARCAAVRAANGIDYPYPYLVGHVLLFSRDGQTLYSAGSSIAEAWDVSTGNRRFAVNHDATCWALALSPDGRILATGGYDSIVHLVDAHSGNSIGSPIPHPRQIIGLDFSPDGKSLCTACQDNEIRLWDVASQTLRYALPSAVGKLSDARFTPDSRFVVEASAATCRLWDAATGEVVSPSFTLGGFHLHLDITPDGHYLATGGSVQPAKYSQMIIDLSLLTAPATASIPDATRWAELLACGHIQGASFVRLTNEEWLTRWRQLPSHQSPP